MLGLICVGGPYSDEGGATRRGNAAARDAQAKQLAHDDIAADFDRVMNVYDLSRRLSVVYDVLLRGFDLHGKRLLDVGCGTGWFSRRARALGAGEVVSLDIGMRLLQVAGQKCDSRKVAGDAQALPFGDGRFDVVVSSEMIEHVPEPRRAFTEMARVLRPGGTLALTTPNKPWHFAVALANALGARPYRGLENWVSRSQLREWAREDGLMIERLVGVHLFPFVLKATYPVLRYFDRFGDALGPLMVNIALRARKAGPEGART